MCQVLKISTMLQTPFDKQQMKQILSVVLLLGQTSAEFPGILEGVCIIKEAVSETIYKFHCLTDWFSKHTCERRAGAELW